MALKIVKKAKEKERERLQQEAKENGVSVEVLERLYKRKKQREVEQLFFDFIYEEGIVECLASELSPMPNERARQMLVEKSGMSEKFFNKISENIDFNVYSRVKVTLEKYIIKG